MGACNKIGSTVCNTGTTPGAVAGVPQVTYTTSPTSSDFYAAASGVCDGADDFVVAFWYRHDGPRVPSGFKDIAGNTGGGGGWSLIWSFGQLSFEVFDGSGTSASGNPTDFYAANSYEIGRDIIFIMQCFQSGGVLNVAFWMNGLLLETATAPASGMTVSTGNLTLIGGGEGEGMEGLAYFEGTLTETQLRDWANDAMDAGSVIALPSETNRWSVADNTPAATWAPSTGPASLTRNGTPGSRTRSVNRA